MNAAPMTETKIKPYVYVLIRTDIPIEQQLVQTGHAAWEAGQRFPKPDEVASLIVLSVPGKDELEAASRRLTEHGIDNYLFYEPDFEMGHSALATRALTTQAERDLLRMYPLYRFSPAMPTLAADKPVLRHGGLRLTA